jgi:hypothetical protein
MRPRFYEIRQMLKDQPELRICHVIDKHYSHAEENMDGFGPRYLALVPGEQPNKRHIFDEAWLDVPMTLKNGNWLRKHVYDHLAVRG